MLFRSRRQRGRWRGAHRGRRRQAVGVSARGGVRPCSAHGWEAMRSSCRTISIRFISLSVSVTLIPYLAMLHGVCGRGWRHDQGSPLMRLLCSNTSDRAPSRRPSWCSTGGVQVSAATRFFSGAGRSAAALLCGCWLVEVGVIHVFPVPFLDPWLCHF